MAKAELNFGELGGGGISNSYYYCQTSGLSTSNFTEFNVGFEPKMLFYHVSNGTDQLMFKWDFSSDTLVYYYQNTWDNDGSSWIGQYVKFENNKFYFKQPSVAWSSWIGISAVG